MTKHGLRLVATNQRASKTPPFLGFDGKVVPGSIAEASYMRLGGLEQWVMIRGENLANPVLVVLHGGPGFSDTAFLRYHTPELEKSFTVVYWDQRGTGRSYRPTIPPSSMTVAQFVADLDELVDLVRRRLGKDKVAILGHSWGSALGALYAARVPEKVAVYVGVTQAVPALEVPVVFMLGRRDPWIPAETSVAYFDVLRAPSKKLVWFDESGHEPFVDESSKFVAAMLDVVRPLCAPSPEIRPDVGNMDVRDARAVFE